MSVWGVDDPAMFWQKLGVLLGLTALYTAAYALLARAVFGFAERSAQRNGRFDMF